MWPLASWSFAMMPTWWRTSISLTGAHRRFTTSWITTRRGGCMWWSSSAHSPSCRRSSTGAWMSSASIPAAETGELRGDTRCGSVGWVSSVLACVQGRAGERSSSGGRWGGRAQGEAWANPALKPSLEVGGSRKWEEEVCFVRSLLTYDMKDRLAVGAR